MGKQLIAFFVLLVGCASSPNRDSASALSARVQINVKHVSKNEWQANYQLDRPMKQVIFSGDKPFRGKTFRFADPAFEVREAGGKEMLSREDNGAFQSFSFMFNPYLESPGGAYPFSFSFSDGSLLLNSSYLLLEMESLQPQNISFALESAEGEEVLINGFSTLHWAPEGDYDFAYFFFGPRKPYATDPFTILADPKVPDWLTKLSRTSVTEIYKLYEREFRQSPKTALIINFKDIDNKEANGYGGSAYPGGILTNISGAEWREPSREFRNRFLSLFAHEGMHRFQGRPKGNFLDRAWLMEGSAVFFAAEILHRLSIENRTEFLGRLSDSANKCVIILSQNQMNLKKPTMGESFGATYYCGHILHYTTHIALIPKVAEGMFALWRKMLEYAQANNGSLEEDYYWEAMTNLSVPTEYANLARKFISEQHADPRKAITELLQATGVKFKLRPPKKKDEHGLQFEFI